MAPSLKRCTKSMVERANRPFACILVMHTGHAKGLLARSTIDCVHLFKDGAIQPKLNDA